MLVAGAASAAAGLSASARPRDAMIQRQSFTSGGRTIAVEVFEPEGSAGRRPAVLMLHGADGLSSNGRYRSGARGLADAGYRVYLVHYLDRTGETRASFATLFRNFEAWMETARDALAFVAARPEVDPERIGIVGISLGAALGLAISGGERRVRALVSYFGPLPQGAVSAAATLPPTLVLHGAADPVVPALNAQGIEALLRRQGVPHEVKVYPGEGHGFRGAAERDATARVIAFLERHLKGASRAHLQAAE
jgi:carboxymethylenebutenolidase